jgi:hypothetical protein
MPDMLAAGNLVRQDDAFVGIRAGFGQACRVKQSMVAPCVAMARLVPAVDVFELDLENCAWKPSMRAFQPISS